MHELELFNELNTARDAANEIRNRRNTANKEADNAAVQITKGVTIRDMGNGKYMVIWNRDNDVTYREFNIEPDDADMVSGRSKQAEEDATSVVQKDIPEEFQPESIMEGFRDLV
ncbi:hypothetical protein RZS08_56865, partial [Arthrospira platensis SPKY1]|nr:hypothetical protein [Arthrospira platensis SPKY1]